MRLRSSWRTLSACFRYRSTGEVLFIIPQAEKYATAPGATRTFAPSSSWRGVVANTTAVIYNLYSFGIFYLFRCIVPAACPQDYDPAEHTGMDAACRGGGAAGWRGCGRVSPDLALRRSPRRSQQHPVKCHFDPTAAVAG